MTRHLYLLRHAKAEPWNPLANDFSRSLDPRGARHASDLAAWAAATLPPPDAILCSPAKRTRQTLAPLLERWPDLLASTDYVNSMYGASLDMLLQLAEDAFSYSERLLMVGHNPGFENLLAAVSQRSLAAGPARMATGTLAVIAFQGGFRRSAHAGELLHLVRRKDFSGE